MKAELLTPIGIPRLMALARDDNYGFQQKHDGHRTLVEKHGNAIRTYNREGEPTHPLPPSLQGTLLASGIPDFYIDTERVARRLIVLDVVSLLGSDLRALPYSSREPIAHQAFDCLGPGVEAIGTILGTEAKLAYVEYLIRTKAEGVVVRDMRKPYREGDACQHFKLKFVKECDAVVIGPSPDGKDSVRIGLYRGDGTLHEISGVSLRNKFRVQPGDVITVRYLCATRDLHIREPHLVRKRDDKRASDCWLSQLTEE
jgi:ATP-dependent DNA ligase